MTDIPMPPSDLLDTLSEGIILLDGDEGILLANASVRRIFGDLAIGRPLASILDPSSAETVAEHLSKVADGADAILFETTLGKGPEAVKLSWSARRRGGYSILSVKDQTELKVAKTESRNLAAALRDLQATVAVSQELLRSNNLEMNRSLEQLQRKNAELSEATRIKGEFVANMSHELRTPLNGIIGGLSLIVDDLCDSPEERETYTRDALAHAQHLLVLINDILEISRIESGKNAFEIGDVLIQPMFESLLGTMGPLARKAGLQLCLTVEGMDPNQLVVKSDTASLRRILTVLIDNGIKFTSEGEVRVTISEYPGDARTLLFTVEDTGIGIPDEYHDKVFEKFFQVDGSSTRRFHGTGLGLSIARSLVEGLGGQIWILKHGTGKGTTICFTQPVGGPEPASASPSSAADAGELEELLPSSF